MDAPDRASTTRRVVAVKVENAPEARPQSGLDQADVVYETMTEGGITRFTALFQSKSPPVVGPVRSARASDLYVVPQYQALFAHCGGESNVQKVLLGTSFADMDQYSHPGPYFRTRDKPAPHNLYLSLGDLQKAVRAGGLPETVTVRPFLFDRYSSTTTPTTTGVTVPFAADNRVSWLYDVATGSYLRSINGTPHKDKVSGRRYSARNVVVMWAMQRPRAHRDAAGVPALDIKLVGSGRAAIFRDGRHFDGVWQAKGDKPPVFKTQDGVSLRLSPGNSWFEVIANDQDIVIR